MKFKIIVNKKLMIWSTSFFYETTYLDSLITKSVNHQILFIYSHVLVSHMITIISSDLVSNGVGPTLICQPMRDFKKCGRDHVMVIGNWSLV